MELKEIINKDLDNSGILENHFILWNDVIEEVKRLEMRKYYVDNGGHGKVLFKKHFRSLLKDMEIPQIYHYPIMVINGYSDDWNDEDALNESYILVPKDSLLEDIYERLSMTVGIHSNIF